MKFLLLLKRPYGKCRWPIRCVPPLVTGGTHGFSIAGCSSGWEKEKKELALTADQVKEQIGRITGYAQKKGYQLLVEAV
jgi:hypothetical protein